MNTGSFCSTTDVVYSARKHEPFVVRRWCPDRPPKLPGRPRRGRCGRRGVSSAVTPAHHGDPPRSRAAKGRAMGRFPGEMNLSAGATMMLEAPHAEGAALWRWRDKPGERWGCGWLRWTCSRILGGEPRAIRPDRGERQSVDPVFSSSATRPDLILKIWHHTFLGDGAARCLTCPNMADGVLPWPGWRSFSKPCRSTRAKAGGGRAGGGDRIERQGARPRRSAPAIGRAFGLANRTVHLAAFVSLQRTASRSTRWPIDDAALGQRWCPRIETAITRLPAGGKSRGRFRARSRLNSRSPACISRRPKRMRFSWCSKPAIGGRYDPVSPWVGAPVIQPAWTSVDLEHVRAVGPFARTDRVRQERTPAHPAAAIVYGEKPARPAAAS